MQVPLMVLGAALLVAGPPPKAPSGTVKVQNCLISLINEAQVPARESGQLVSLAVREGQQVQQDGVVGQIDDSLAQRRYEVAQFERGVAEEEATNEIHVHYAEAAHEVAKAQHQAGLEANRKFPGTVPLMEMKQRALKVIETKLAIDQAKTNLYIAGLKLKVREAEVRAAAEARERHLIKSPLDGVVVELYRHQGEWVQTTNDPVVMRIIGLDKLRVEGFLNIIDDVFPNKIDDRKPVKIDVEVASKQWVSVPGKIVFISDLPQPGGDYQVWAEIENPQQDGRWLLRPSLNAEMTIQLK